MRLRTIGLGVSALAIAAAPIALSGVAGASKNAPHRTLRAAILAHPRWVLANGTASAKIVVRISKGFAGSSGASVTLTTADTPSGGGSCGTLGAASGTTGKHGFFTTSYTASSTVGFCTITATSGTATAAATIDQIDPTLYAAKTHYRVHGTASAHRIPGNGTSTSTITYTVTNGTTPIAGDALLVSSVSLGRGACGTTALSSPTTNASGQVTVTYTSSAARGLCLLWATEASTGHSSNGVLIFQTK